MFGSRQQGTVIPKGLKIVGSVTADGLVWVNGQIDGELHCTYQSSTTGRISAELFQPSASSWMGKFRRSNSRRRDRSKIAGVFVVASRFKRSTSCLSCCEGLLATETLTKR